MNTKHLILYFLGEAISLAAAGVALFWSAGRMDWWAAWAVLTVWLVWFAAIDSVILTTNPTLLIERLSPPKDARAWDRSILSIVRLIELARYILAGLDLRHGWTVGFPLAAQGAGVIVCLVGTGLFAWALASNTFFSQVVRIQSDRGHAVARGGPYRFIRHPGYLGTILFEVALSVTLGSWWAILASGVCVVLFLLRTALEDRTLQEELPGYREYAQQVRYRLIPWIY